MKMRAKFGKILTLVIYVLFVVFGTAKAIPNEYIPNYTINTSRNSILEILTRIEAYRKTGKSIPSDVFAKLYGDFATVWPRLPQDPWYKVVYEQCNITTNDLSKLFSYDKFSTFIDQCYEPIIRITSEINAKYTIVPSIKVSPDNWPAPLTVTFDARNSIDPSNDTIPSDNYFWYYKDTQWITKIIWKWPVVNHTFTEAGNYIIHSTIRSVNSNKWVLDWEAVTNVNVAPQSANIAVFANGKKMNEDGYVKVWTTEAKNWVTLDWTATTPNGGRKIKSHVREINSVDGYKNIINSEWSPSVAKFVLPWNGIYTVKLSVNDNENNTVYKSYQLVVSDPVAIIKQSPEAWTTSTKFSFDAGNSYSVSSKVKMYKWEVFDTNSNIIDTIQSKQINKQFIKPWIYTIKLTVYDEYGNNNIEQTKLIVESTEPIAQYTATATQARQESSQYIFDAGNSFDIDVSNNFDKLTYERKIWSNNVKIEQSFDNNKKALISFNEKWTYSIWLVVRDNFGKVSEIYKNFIVNSTIRPVITAEPGATIRWKSIKFTTKSNKPIISYRRDFGDNITKSSTETSAFHEYKTAGIYIVKLYVTTNNLEENSIQIPIFIWEANKPIAVYDVINNNQQTLLADQICTSSDGDKIAYKIDRYEQVELNTSNSLDVKWQKNNLNIYFKPQNDNIFKWANLKYKFSEVWCQYVDIVVEDKNESSIDKKRIYFKVRNALPSLNNVVISFPQYNNEVWVWFMQTKLQDLSFSQFDPLAVRVAAETPIDKDGQISYFTRYYYKTDDPDRLLDIKITPWNSNWVVFNISREAGEYTFGVKMTDNDGWEKTSEEIIWKWPIVSIQPKWNDGNDIPVVTLKSNTTIAKVWETVKFSTISKILSDRPDFKANRVFKYDFDGDGIYDLTTKEENVTYQYIKASSNSKWYTPKVKVIYKEKVWEALGDAISVKKWLKPQFDYITNDKTIFVKDSSLWITENTKVEYCMDIKNCKKSEYINNINGNSFFKFDYPDYGKYLIKVTASDDFWNTEKINQVIELSKPDTKNFVNIITFPKISKSEEWENIQIGKILNNTVSVYVKNNSENNCNISAIVWWNTKEYKCDEINNIKFDDDQEVWYINIKYSNDKWQVDRQIKIILIDNQYIVPDKYIPAAKQIDIIRKNIIGKSQYIWLDQKLSEFRKSLWDRTAMNDIIPSIKDYISTMSGGINSGDIGSLNKLVDGLSDKSTKAILWASDYEQSKWDIISAVSTDIKDQIWKLFDNIDSANGDKDIIYAQMTWILSLVKDEVAKTNMDPADFEIIKWQICEIAKYKEIPTESCINTELKPVSTWDVVVAPSVKSSTDTWTDNTLVKTVIKVMLWVVWVIVILFIWWVVYYAIKKKREQSDANSNATPTV